MVELQIVAVVAMGEEHVIVQKLFEREVGGVPAVAMDHHVAGLGFQANQRNHVLGHHAFPHIVETRPGSDTMEIGGAAALWESAELLIIQSPGFFDETEET